MRAIERLAQTNLQLYAQLRTDGWAADELEAVGRAYELAGDLVSGWHRASGKPLIDHFVGTASAVAAAGGRPTLVRAALLHNAYLATGVHDRVRREVRQAVGVEAESLVFAHQAFPWDDAAVAALLTRVDRLNGKERDLTVLRLANEVDDVADLGRLHGRQARLDLAPVIELADRLGEASLADALRAGAEAEAVADVDPGLVGPSDRPVFHQPRVATLVRVWTPWVRRQGRRVAHRLHLR